MVFEVPKYETPRVKRETNQLDLLPSSAYDQMEFNALRIWCHLNARYGLPTIELVDWLKDFIGDKKAIEIGSGHGDLAFHLGITGTDSKCQEEKEVIAYYQLLSQPLIKYPGWVEKIEALDAVKKYLPDIVIASWVTQWVDPKLPAPPEGGCMYGVKEDLLLEMGITYVLIGNLSVHGQKRIRKIPHEEFNLQFVKSRSSLPELNRILVWRPERSSPG